jgi:hypothetical protein
MYQLLDGEKLLFKNYIRLLFKIREKVNTFKNKVDAQEPTNDAFLEYLRILQGQVIYNKHQNNEDINTRALDETYVEAIIGQRVYSIDKSTQQKASKATKSMSKVVERLLTSIQTISDKKKHSYLDSELKKINKEDLKTLDKVLDERRAYFDDKYSKDRTNKDIIRTIETIDNIRSLIDIESGEEY